MEDAANQSFNATPIIVLQTSNVPEFNPNLASLNVWKERLDIHFCEINCLDENCLDDFVKINWCCAV